MRLSQTVHKTEKMNEGDKPKGKKATKRNKGKIELFIELLHGSSPAGRASSRTRKIFEGSKGQARVM